MRAAFVATNSIVQGEQAAILWKYLMLEKGCRIDFAYRTFKWINEAENPAAVHCVIVGFSCAPPRAPLLLIDEQGVARQPKQINNYLMDAPNLFAEKRSRPLCDAPMMIRGSQATDQGNLIIEAEDYDDFIAREPRAGDFIRPFMGAEELINGKKRYCLWLVDVPPNILRSMPHVMHRLEKVRDFRLRSPKEPTRRCADTPALFQEIKQPKSNYLAVPSVSSENREYVPLAYCDASIIASDRLRIVPDASLYHFGILTSAMHMAWMRTVAGRMRSDYSYSASIVYNNFPWPTPTDTQRTRIESAAQVVLDTRDKYPDNTLADLYDPTFMPPDLRSAHKALDSAVDAAYGRKFPDEAARVAHLFSLYSLLSQVKNAT